VLDDALDVGAEVLASVVGWRARRKAARQGEPTPLADGEFAVWEHGRLRSRPAGRISVHGDTVRWAGPGTDPGPAREVPGAAVRFRVEHGADGTTGARVRLQLPDARPLTATVSHEEPAGAGSSDPDDERRLAACAAELVDLLRRAGAVEEVA
jgi:hypothetical protein